MREPKTITLYATIVTVAILILCLILLGFQTLWSIFGSSSSILIQTNIQRVRAETFSKDALLLQYSKDKSADAQALSEFQQSLPLFEQVQRGLAVGNSSLNLPQHVPEDVLSDVLISNQDFTAIDAAVKMIILNNEKPIDPVEVQIILAHEHGYASAMTVVSSVWQQHIDSSFLHIFIIEAVLDCIIMLLIVFKHVFFVVNIQRGHYG